MADIDSVSSSVDGMNLPYSPEAEQAVLATIIMDGECMAEVIQILPQAECFYLATHRSIYTAMIELLQGHGNLLSFSLSMFQNLTANFLCQRLNISTIFGKGTYR